VTATQPSIEGSNERTKAYRVVVAANTVFAKNEHTNEPGPKPTTSVGTQHDRTIDCGAIRAPLILHASSGHRALHGVLLLGINGVSACGTDTILDRLIVATVAVLAIEAEEAEAVQATGSVTTVHATSSRGTSICRVDIDES
jgi:hypothetical protein